MPTVLPTRFPTGEPTVSPIDVPTTTPTVSPEPTILILCNGRTLQERNDELETIVLEISELTSFTLGTPQYDAFEWLANDDGFQVCPEDTQNILQRYVLAVLYYSTGGDDWNNCRAVTAPNGGPCTSDSSRFLSSSDVCFWYGVSCNRGDVDGISIGKCSSEHDYFNLDECQF